MSYIGNNPDVNAFTIGVDRFNGTGACTQFTLTRSISDAKAIEVVVNGVQQDPDNSYTVSSGVLTFDEAPSSGTNNITVTYRAPVVVTFNQVTPSQLQANAVTTTAVASNAITSLKIADGSVTGNKLGITSISANNIAAGAITGNLLALNIINSNNIVDASILGNDIAPTSVSANHITLGAITTNLIATQAISGNQIGIGAITGNLIGTRAVSGNQIGIGAISANNFAGGGITSNVLASNLSISTVRVAETINVVTTSISGNYTIHVGNSTSYYFVSNAAGSITFNLVANDGTATGTTGSLNDLLQIGQTASIAIALKQGSTRYRANVFVDGVNPLTSVFWMGSSQPAQLGAQSQSIDAYTINVIKIGSGSYTIMMSNTTYGYANGQGMGPGGVQ